MKGTSFYISIKYGNICNEVPFFMEKSDCRLKGFYNPENLHLQKLSPDNFP